MITEVGVYSCSRTRLSIHAVFIVRLGYWIQEISAFSFISVWVWEVSDKKQVETQSCQMAVLATPSIHISQVYPYIIQPLS
jgi:hypothetical protein